jgi:hypothetical protein
MRHTLRKTVGRAALAAASMGLVAAGTAGVAATPAHAAQTVCNVHVDSLTSYDLADNDGVDEIKIKLGDSPWAGPYDFKDNWTKNKSLGNLNKDFTKSVVVRLAEQDLTRHQIAQHTLKCTADLGTQTKSFVGYGAIYDMVLTVTKH